MLSVAVAGVMEMLGGTPLIVTIAVAVTLGSALLRPRMVIGSAGSVAGAV